MSKYDEINKKNLPKWEKSLKYLTNILKENNITYYLSAAGLHYVLGEENVYPYDIDLFMSEKDVKKAFEILKEYTVSDLHKWENRLLEFQGEYLGTPFEICEWEKEPESLTLKNFKDIKVYI